MAMATAEAAAATTAHGNNRNVTNRKICTIYIPNRPISTAIPRIPTPRSLLFFCARDPANQKHDHEEELIRSDPNRAGAAASRQQPPAARHRSAAKRLIILIDLSCIISRADRAITSGGRSHLISYTIVMRMGGGGRSIGQTGARKSGGKHEFVINRGAAASAIHK